MSHDNGYEFFKEDKPKIIIFHDMKLVKISDVGEEFRRWLYGQTMTMVDDKNLNDGDMFNWAYYCDYERFINNYPIID